MELIVGFEGRKQDVTDLLFGLFGEVLEEGSKKEAPGGVTVVLKPMPLRKGALVQTVLQVGLFVGVNIAVPLFVAWLYDVWKHKGQKPVSVKIDGRNYQFDPAILAMAIEEAISKQAEEKEKK